MHNWSYSRWNIILGWIVFIIASIVYLSTIEPEFSFWDCAEYISSAAKLEVTHSPGAALFQLVGAVFAGLAFGDESKYSFLINSMSAIFSALTILLMFWTITHLILKALNWKRNELSKSQMIIILGGGLIGSLSFMFSDTIWFSAVEGEVYSMASLFSALLVWLICKWENEANNMEANRWLILISFIIGLSVGVHMMVLLAVPAVCIIYYAQRYPLNIKTFIVANIITLFVLLLVFKWLFPFIMNVFGKMEIFFVNGLGLPFHSGTIFTFFLLGGIFYFLLSWTKKKNYPIINSISLSLLFMIIGFSCWMMIAIRANANPPMNLNNPDNAIGLKDYYNREQYGEWPVLYGPNYTAYLDQNGIIGNEFGETIYEKDEQSGTYKDIGKRFNYKFNPDHVSVLPRMYYPGNENGVQDNYGSIAGYPDFKINPEYANEPQAVKLVQELKDKREKGDIKISDYQQYKELLKIEKPTFWQNIDYMTSYQFGFMYLRYFLWNFVGKQNDFESNWEDTHGNWMSGIKWIDEYNLGPLDKLPSKYQNKGTNKYYFLPLILGLIGFFFQLNRDPSRTYALVVMFLLTGLGIILYTSVKPFEPRERDYALVTSFYTFGIWIGIGAATVMYYLWKWKTKSVIVGLFLLLGIPALMGFQNWDDHDRSRRQAAYDFAKSTLTPLGEKAILFVYGDNDTYPLWGGQEVANMRRDVKVVNFTLLGTVWYIDQVKRKTYTAPSIPSKLTHEEYRDGKNDAIQVISKKDWEELFKQIDEAGIPRSQFSEFVPFLTKDSITIQEAVNFLKKKSEQKDELLKNFFGEENYDEYNFLPCDKIVIPVNKENALKYGIINAEDKDSMVDNLKIQITAGTLRKAELMMLDMMANYQWDRPIYFSNGGPYDPSNVFFMQDYLEFQGFVYKLVPIYTPENDDQIGRVNADNIYKAIKQYSWSNYKDPHGYFDDTSKSNIPLYRKAVGRAVEALYEKGDIKKAKELLELVNKEIPINLYPGSPSINDIIYGYILVGEENKALALAKKYEEELFKDWDYYINLPKEKQKFVYSKINQTSAYYGFLRESIYDGYIKLNKKDKAYESIEKSFTPVDKRFNKIVSDMEMMGQKQNPNEAALNSYINSYQHLTEIISPLDSTYSKEKMKSVVDKVMKASK